jgi:hypothetical protein
MKRATTLSIDHRDYSASRSASVDVQFFCVFFFSKKGVVMRASLRRFSSAFHKKIDAANAEALARMAKADIVLEDLRPAREFIPALADPTRKLVLISGPPVTWKKMGNAQKGAVAGICIFEVFFFEKKKKKKDLTFCKKGMGQDS